jgi:acetylornithine deacetylase
MQHWLSAMHLISLFCLLLLPVCYGDIVNYLQYPIQRISNDVLSSRHLSELLSLHESLVNIESISGNEREVAYWLRRYLANSGFHVELQEVEKDRYNVLAWTNNVKNMKEVDIVVSSHIDTVPPFIPYKRNSNGTISGRGSVDAKGSVAAQIMAVRSILECSEVRLLESNTSIGLLFVVDEEAGGRGMRHFSSSPLNRKNYTAVIFGEPTESKLCAGHKGITLFQISVKGRAAHSGYPWLGLSANDVLVQALSKLKELEAHPGKDGFPNSEKYGNTTLNIGQMSGGVANNVVAESASAKIAVRIAASTPQHIHDIARQALEPIMAETEAMGGSLTFNISTYGYAPVNIDCDIEGFECLTVNYGTDVPNLQLSQSTKRYLYGPGNIMVAHGPREALEVKELEQAVLDYRKLIKTAIKNIGSTTDR